MSNTSSPAPISTMLDTMLRLMKTSLPSPSVTAWLMRPSLKKKSFAEPLLVTPCITPVWRLTRRFNPSPVSVMPLLNVLKLSMKLIGPVRLKVPFTAPPARMITEFSSVLVIVRPALNIPWLSTKFLAPVMFARPLTLLPAKMFSVFWPLPVIVMPPLLIDPVLVDDDDAVAAANDAGTEASRCCSTSWKSRRPR